MTCSVVDSSLPLDFVHYTFSIDTPENAVNPRHRYPGTKEPGSQMLQCWFALAPSNLSFVMLLEDGFIFPSGPPRAGLHGRPASLSKNITLFSLIMFGQHELVRLQPMC